MTTVVTKLKSNSQHKTSALRVFLRLIFAVAFGITSHQLNAGTADWLAIDLNMNERSDSLTELRAKSVKILDDEVLQSTSVVQSIRAIMNRDGSSDIHGYVDALITTNEMGAEDWLKKIPRAKNLQVMLEDSAEESKENLRRRILCHLEIKESRFTCDDTNNSTLTTASSDEAPSSTTYGKALIAQVVREGLAVQKSQNFQSEQRIKARGPGIDNDVVVLKPRRDGLVVATSGTIKFNRDSQTKKVTLDAQLKNVAVEIFVRDPSIVVWDPKLFRLSGVKSGATEVFVVTPGRISIIEASVSDLGADGEGARIAKSKAGTIEVPSSLASLDGLDYAATKGTMSASHGGLQDKAPDLTISNELSAVGEPGLNSGETFVRAKAKADFENIRIKIVDDRTQPGVNYPVSGARIKIAGTEFNELTNVRGEVDVRDVPVGARLLVEISDDRGYLMPQVTEIAADRDGVSRSLPQTIVARRFVSLDLIARSAGVVQDMQKSSFCGTITRGANTLSGVSLSLDVSGVGPFYFNNLGLVDRRLGGTGSSGRFCFFNVDPGPVTIGFSQSGQDQLATVVGAVQGRHLEESFDLTEARHVSSTISAVASANDQLGSEPVRANRYELMDQADVYAIGSGELMTPVDEGIMTTSSNVLPFKGRVWTVSASSDFDTTIQSVHAKADNTKQILTLIPNGFVNDMSYFANTIHSADQGSVVVEHGNLGGHGDQPVKMRLVDSFGHDVGDGWYFADKPVAKAIFFNVPAGIYSALIETQSGHWISADTVVVYSESVSIVKTGSKVERLSRRVQSASLD